MQPQLKLKTIILSFHKVAYSINSFLFFLFRRVFLGSSNTGIMTSLDSLPAGANTSTKRKTNVN